MTHLRILVLSASAGTGHTRAAKALRACASAQQPSLEATHLDALQFVTPLLRFVYTDAYLFLVRHAPALWRHLHHTTNIAKRDGLGHRIRRWAERLNSKSLPAENCTTEARPDHLPHLLSGAMVVADGSANHGVDHAVLDRRRLSVVCHQPRFWTAALSSRVRRPASPLGTRRAGRLLAVFSTQRGAVLGVLLRHVESISNSAAKLCRRARNDFIRNRKFFRQLAVVLETIRHHE